MFFSEILVIPSGLSILMVLTRVLGPHNFGLYTLTAAIVTWIEWSLTTLFGRASIKLVGETEDWRPVAAAVLRLNFLASSMAALCLMFLSPFIAVIFHERELISYLRWFLLYLPVISLCHASRAILIGRERFREASWLSATRWISRPILIIVLVSIFRSVPAAIIAWLGAAVAELAMGRILVPVPVFLSTSRRVVFHLFAYAAPLSAFGLILRLYDKIDLFMLKLLGGTAEMAGVYGAAQNVSVVLGIFTISFSPLLLATLNRLLVQGAEREVRELTSNAFRALLLLFPFIAIVAASSAQVVLLVFGPAFTGARTILTFLVFSAYFIAVVSVGASILTAYGRPSLLLVLSVPMLPLACWGYFLFIPRYGPTGAAIVSAVVAGIIAFGELAVIFRIQQARPRTGTIVRSILISSLVWTVAAFWNTSGYLTAVKLITCGLIIPPLYILLGELNQNEASKLRGFWQALRRKGTLIETR
jgi:O-antigen/teichoic acid export membrane protein